MQIGGRIDLLEPHPEFSLFHAALPVAGHLRCINEPDKEPQNNYTKLQRGPNMPGKALGLEFEGIFDRADRCAVHAPVAFRAPNTFPARHG